VVVETLYFLANRVLFALRLRGSIDYIRLPGKSCAKHPSLRAIKINSGLLVRQKMRKVRAR
jgi:hypothetical protein